MATISLETLFDLAEGRLSAEKAAAVQAQLAQADAETQADWHWVQGFGQISAAIDLPAPPATIRPAILAALRDKTKKPSILERITATLSFDSWQQPGVAIAGARSAAADEPRQMLFVTPHVDISLEIDQQTINGQILGEVQENWYTIALLQHGQTVAQTINSQLGEFSFTNVAAGAYTLRLTSADHELRLPSIEL